MIVEKIIQLTVNVDDMTGEEIGYAFDVFFQNGALDVFTQSIQMKKNRPATMIHVLAKEGDKEKFVHLLLEHTSSIGVRVSEFQRYSLPREEKKVNTSLGTVSVKISESHEKRTIRRVKIEYKDLQQIAKKMNISLREVRDILEKEIP